MRGIIVTFRRLALTLWAGEANTALRVTSEPVPAVVGIARIGKESFASVFPRPTTSR